MSKLIIEKLGITPPPWTNAELQEGKYLPAKDGCSLLSTCTEENPVTGETAEWGIIGSKQDAQLIAAAPEMLEALIDITSEQESYYRNMFIESGWEKLFYKKHGTQVSIVEKATGRTWDEIKELLNE